VSSQSKCVCGKRIMFVDGEWHHVWWKKDRETGKFVMNGCQACAWAGRPDAGVVLALPVASSSSRS